MTQPTAEQLTHDAAIDAICGCAATVTVLSYQEAIESYLNLRGIDLDAPPKAAPEQEPSGA